MQIAAAVRVSVHYVKCSANLNRKWTAQVFAPALTALNTVHQ